MPPQPASGGSGSAHPRGTSRRAALFGGTPQGELPGGLAAHILEFGEELRGEGVAVGTSELLDAFSALPEVEWTEPAAFREVLAATLAKSPDDQRIFNLVFDRFFFRAVELAAIQEGIREAGQGGSMDEAGDELNLDALRRQIAQMIADGNESALRDLARLAIAAFGQQGEGSGVIGVDVQRIRRQLGLRGEPQPELPQEDPRREGLPRDGIRRFEQLLRQELERRQIERTEALPPARPLNELDRALPSGPLSGPRERAPRRRAAQAPPEDAGQRAPRAASATPTSTCGARCARRWRPAACPSS